MAYNYEAEVALYPKRHVAWLCWSEHGPGTLHALLLEAAPSGPQHFSLTCPCTHKSMYTSFQAALCVW